MANANRDKTETTDGASGITSIAVKGFKSIEESTRIDIAPLTLLAGANSSGKSSIMQALLLLKQTLEANYDPGPLLLHGPNVRYTDASQFLSRNASKLEIEVAWRPTEESTPFRRRFLSKEAPPLPSFLMFKTVLSEALGGLLAVESNEFTIDSGEPVVLRLGMSSSDLRKALVEIGGRTGMYSKSDLRRFKPKLVSDRFWLKLVDEDTELPIYPFRAFSWFTVAAFDELRRMLHVPGLRGNPERAYQIAATGPLFPGTFENYVAGVLKHWQSKRDTRVKHLNSALDLLGLTWKIAAQEVDRTKIELKVGRTRRAPRGGAHDLVSIADVGFGVSQVLPVLVALLTADKGTLVFIEQPEIHLHPRAQAALARVLADAAERGVRVVAETHSSTLLLAMRGLVASGLDPDLIRLHWFTRGEQDGITRVSSAKMDSLGRWGEWPEDFGSVEGDLLEGYFASLDRKAK